VTTPSNLSLSDFLLARLAEDEADVYPLDTDESGKTIYADLGSARVLREVEAMRRIVTYFAWEIAEATPQRRQRMTDMEFGRLLDAERTLGHLATIWADHPDYREEWKL
jgi:hypothetical protein